MPAIRVHPRHMPARTDGEAHLFNEGSRPFRLMVISTTGCIAVRNCRGNTRIFHWYYRAKGKDPIVIEDTHWCIVWSCRAPWNEEPAGHITRLHCSQCGLVNMDVRSLSRLVHLRCFSNQLEHLDCSGLQYLRSLDCSDNRLRLLDTTGCPKLKRTVCDGNPELSAGCPMHSTALLPRNSTAPKDLLSTSLFDL